MGKVKTRSHIDEVSDSKIGSPSVKKSISKKKSDQKKTGVGKPQKLNVIQIQKPEIWSTDIRCLIILKFLLHEGRFLSPHLAGIKRKQEKIEKSKDQSNIQQINDQAQEIKDKKAIYEFIEKFSIDYLGMPRRQTNKARLTVFFFKYGQLKEAEQQLEQTNNELSDWQSLLKKFSFLLSFQFYQELKLILEQIFDENQEPRQIANSMLESNKPIQQADEILKCLFVQQIENQNITIGDLNKLNRDQVQEKFEVTVQKLKNKLILFVENIKNIFEGEDYIVDDQDNQQFIDQNILYEDYESLIRYSNDQYCYDGDPQSDE